MQSFCWGDNTEELETRLIFARKPENTTAAQPIWGHWQTNTLKLHQNYALIETDEFVTDAQLNVHKTGPLGMDFLIQNLSINLIRSLITNH